MKCPLCNNLIYIRKPVLGTLQNNNLYKLLSELAIHFGGYAYGEVYDEHDPEQLKEMLDYMNKIMQEVSK